MAKRKEEKNIHTVIQLPERNNKSGEERIYGTRVSPIFP